MKKWWVRHERAGVQEVPYSGCTMRTETRPTRRSEARLVMAGVGYQMIGYLVAAIMPAL